MKILSILSVLMIMTSAAYAADGPQRHERSAPRCAPHNGKEGRFDPQLGLCVATEITRVQVSEEHRNYLRNCSTRIETRVIRRGNRMVEQQRCAPQ